jgi:hypothetical protein
MSRARSFSKLINKDNYATYRGSDSVTDISAVSLPQGTLSFRNRIINGDMRIDQRNAGASVTFNDETFPVDRFRGNCTQSSKLNAQKSTNAPSGFTNSLLITSSSSDSVADGDVFQLSQFIEGFNVGDLGWGTLNAKTITVSFWVRSSLTGTFGGALKNSTGGDRSYPFVYTISLADNWEYKTVTIPGDTSGTWLTDNSLGIRLSFSLGAGLTYSGTAGAWAGANYWSATGATSIVGTSGATFYITGVQLEEGTVPTPFEHRPYGLELSLCKRYCQVIQMIGLFIWPYSSDRAWLGLPLMEPLRDYSSIQISKTRRVARVTTYGVLDYWISGGNVYNTGDWLNDIYFGGYEPGYNNEVTHMGAYILKSGSGNFSDQEPVTISGVVNTSNNGFDSDGGFIIITSELT